MNQEIIPNSQFPIQNSQWWVQRWLELLDSYRFKKRLERARIYAREGNVLSIDFQRAKAIARVQGTEPEPYQVSLSLSPFTDEDWSYIIETLCQKAIFSAQLLAGQMPENIEAVFIANGLHLFPFSLTEVHARCSCPDKANPCKHIGAVYYQLADRFREDPFVIFQLRGRTKTQILESLRQLRRQLLGIDSSQEVSSTAPLALEEETAISESLFNPETFWKYDESLEPSLVAIVPPAQGKTVLALLSSIPLPYEEAETVSQYLQQVYQMASQQAMITALRGVD